MSRWDQRTKSSLANSLANLKAGIQASPFALQRNKSAHPGFKRSGTFKELVSISFN